MSAEITQRVETAVVKNGVSQSAQHQSSLDMSGTFATDHTQLIPHNSWAQVDFNTVTGTPRFVLLVNLDSTNFVKIAADNAGATPLGRIYANGDFFKASYPTNIYLQADTAGCLVRVVSAQT